MLGVIVRVPTTVYGFEVSRLCFAGTWVEEGYFNRSVKVRFEARVVSCIALIPAR